MINIRKSIILYNFRSAYNVGAMFRTADAVGLDKIYLIGQTAKPVDDFNRPNSKITKTALGAEKNISWEYAKTPFPFIKKFKKAGIKIISLEQNYNSIHYKSLSIPREWVLILGEETKGLTKTILNYSDFIIELPMMGKKESLNVSVAGGVALYYLTNL